MDTPKITGKTKLTALLGSPVAHSLSPRMHNTAFQLLGLDYIYLCFDVTEDRLADAVRGLVCCGIRGFNLTMPNKNRMLELLDVCTPAARLAGAVNTVVVEEGKLTGYNTDGIGLLRALEEAGAPAAGRDLVLLGAGGAATAIASQAVLDGAAGLRIFSRTSSRFHARAQQLTDELNASTSCRVSLHDLAERDALRNALEDADILIQATPVGMDPDIENCLIPDASWLPPHLTVADIIYHPRRTKLLALAEEAGCAVCPGTGMLLHQGAEAFRLWTGQELPLEEVRQALFSE